MESHILKNSENVGLTVFPLLWPKRFIGTGTPGIIITVYITLQEPN